MTNTTKQTKLHLGCGARFIPGYVHIDVIHHPHIDYLCNIDDLSVFQDNSVDVIYNCHVLEHFHRYKVENVLKEWFRVLKPGGILRTSVPDFAALAELYLKTRDLKSVVGPIMGRQNYLYNIHYNIFDYDYFHDLLVKTGFSNIYRYNWRNTEHSDMDDYSQAYHPHMDKENGLLLSLNVEAKK